jgi:hypothetical protein
MSSRSFRRRNNRRRQRSSGEGQPQRQPGDQGQRPVPAEGQQRQGHGPRRPQGQRREGRPGPGKPPEEQRSPLPEPPLVFPDCPVCGKPVRDLASALTHRLARTPAHFDCIMRELRDSNECTAQERICYLGGGAFGILEFRSGSGQSRFVIKKRIQYEEKELPQDWKKPLQVSC